jgi:Glucodextranase, domain N
VADGVLSDVYEPTIDNTDVSTLQYVVTDGATFTAEHQVVDRDDQRPVRLALLHQAVQDR